MDRADDQDHLAYYIVVRRVRCRPQSPRSWRPRFLRRSTMPRDNTVDVGKIQDHHLTISW